MSAEPHPHSRDIGRFVAGELSSTDNRRVVRHLLAGCRRCRRVAAELWRPSCGDGSYSGIGSAVVGAARQEMGIEQERRQAGELLAELDQQTQIRQLLLILNSRRYCNWFVCEALIQRAFEAGPSDPEAAVSQAESAVALAERVLAIKGDEPANRDLLGRAWAVLGNARRLQSDLSGSEEALERAASELEKGSGDPLEDSTLARFFGSLRREQRRFEEALSCYNRAIRHARAAGDSHCVGRAVLDLAATLGESGLHDKQIERLREAIGLLDGEREPRLLLAAQHNLTWALKESGRLDEALSSLQQILPVHVRSAKPMDLLRLRWLEGKLAQAQGELERAEVAFREVCDGFLDRKVPYDAALASLDLAVVFFERHEIGKMKRLAAESLPVFRSLGIHREALAALALFRHAVERERVSMRFLAELADYLQRARSNPEATFRPRA